MSWGAAIGSIVGGLASTAGDLIGAHHDRAFARAQSEADRAFQREVFQNQYQWKAADAKKAGLHPLSVIGGGSYSGSPSSVPVSSMAGGLSSGLGKLGEGIGDSLHAYMTKDEREAEKAEADRRANKAEYWDDKKQLATGRLLDAQTEYYSALAMKTSREALRYSNPMADGSEVIGGQTDANAPRKFERYRNPDGSLSGRLPTSQYQGIYDDKWALEYKPGLEALYWDARDFLADKFGLWNWRGARHGY